MLARSHMPPAVNLTDTDVVDGAVPRPAEVSPKVLQGWTSQFIAQLAVPGAQCLGKSVDGGPMVDYYIDDETGSIASLTPRPDGLPLVREIGPVALWRRIEGALSSWRDIGSPEIEEFHISVTPDQQTVFLPDVPALSRKLPT